MKKANINTVNNNSEADAIVLGETFKDDLKSSILVVSLLANLFVFTCYLVLKTTTAYDYQIIGLLLTR